MALMVKNLLANAGDIRDTGQIPGWGRSPGGRHGNPLHYSYMENPMDRAACWAAVHGVAKELDTTKATQYTCMREETPQASFFLSLSALLGLSERWLSATQG